MKSVSWGEKRQFSIYHNVAGWHSKWNSAFWCRFPSGIAPSGVADGRALRIIVDACAAPIDTRVGVENGLLCLNSERTRRVSKRPSVSLTFNVHLEAISSIKDWELIPGFSE